MKPYPNHDGDSGVVAYEYGPRWICLKFKSGHVYQYTRTSVGPDALEQMKRLADSGRGLATFINQHPGVRDGYV